MKHLFIFRQLNKDRWAEIRQHLNYKLSDLMRQSHYTIFDDDFEVEIRSLKKEPSDNQRAYYFGVVLPTIAKGLKEGDYAYYTDMKDLDNDIKLAVMDRFDLCTKREDKLSKKTVIEPISLSNIKGDKELIQKFIDAVILIAGEFYGIEIPAPNYK